MHAEDNAYAFVELCKRNLFRSAQVIGKHTAIDNLKFETYLT
jgi:hypothetical protein